MHIQKCPLHGQIQNIICCEGQCIRRYCHQCFQLHNADHSNGVIFNQISKQCLIQWNKFLMDKFKQIQNNISSKGSNVIFQLRLNSNYPKGLLSEINNSQITAISTKVIDGYIQTLSTNIEFISTRQSLDELDIPELFKDLFIFFFYDTGNGLNFLAEKVQEQLKLNFPDKKIYQFVQFVFVPKQLRQLQIKRKALTSKSQQQATVRLKKGNGPTSPKPKIDKESPRKNMLLSNNSRMKSYNENSNPSSLTNLEVIQKSANAHLPLYSPLPKSKDPQQVQQKKQNQAHDLKQEKFISSLHSHQLKQNSQIKQQFQQNIKKQPNQSKQKSYANKNSIQQNVPTFKQTQQNFQTKALQKTTQIEEGIENEKLKIRVYMLQQKLKQKDRSIAQLNKLIGNEQQELQFRENQVQILSQQIKKLIVLKQKLQESQKQLEITKSELKLKQKSIAELNKLIGNQQEQLQFRQSQVDTLTKQIKKLVQFKQRCAQIEAKLNQKQRELDLREKGIKQLNNVISNQEEELAFRENQVEMLSTQLRKAEESKVEVERRLQQVLKDHEQLKKHTSQLQIKSLNTIQNESAVQETVKTFDEQLMEEVIQLESQVVLRNQDIKCLSQLINKFQNLIPAGKKDEFISALKTLKTVKIQM